MQTKSIEIIAVGQSIKSVKRLINELEWHQLIYWSRIDYMMSHLSFYAS